ncbi:MAG: phosphocholine cytidylyltransferase family protein [bacterium]
MKKDLETAILLLAGRGSRLEELTENKPKCLVEVNNIPILHRMLDELAHLNIKKIILVVGYLHKQISDYVGNRWNDMKVEYVINKDWDKTNNVVSLYMGLENIETNFLLLEGDIVVSEKALKNFNDVNLLALDKFRNYMDGTVVKLDDETRVEKFYLKSTPGRPDDLTGFYKTVNIYSFDKNEFFEYIKPRLNNIIDSNQVNAYYELAFAQAVDCGEILLKAVDFHHLKWAEIDDQKDLQYAEKLFD